MSEKILIIGYYGMGNVGSDIRLKVIVDDIRRVKPDAKITVAVFKYNHIERIDGVKYIRLKNVFFGTFELISKLKKFKYLIVGEGIPFVDFCGLGFLSFFLPLLYLANKRGLKTSCYSFDIDNLSPINRVLTNKVLRQTDLLLVRSRKSYQILHDANIKQNLVLGSDCSFLYNPKKIKFNKQKFVGFCFKDFYCYPVNLKLFGNKKNLFHYPLYYTYKNNGLQKLESYIDNMAETINDYLMESMNNNVQFIIMEHQMDAPVTYKIYAKIKEKKRVEIVSLKNKSLSYIKQNFANLKCLVTSRYHGFLLSLEYGIPVYLMATDERYEYISGELGLNRFLTNIYKEDIDYYRIGEFIRKRKFSEHNLKLKYKILAKSASKNYQHLIEFLK